MSTAASDTTARDHAGVCAGSFLYLAATLLAFVNVAVSLAIVVGLAILYMLPRAGAHEAVKRAHQ